MMLTTSPCPLLRRAVLPLLLLLLSQALLASSSTDFVVQDDSMAFNTTADAHAAVLRPSRDPWYSAPPGWRLTRPGSVLRVRHAPLMAFAIPSAWTAYQVLFRTTDSNFEPTWAVTTLFVPRPGPRAERQKGKKKGGGYYHGRHEALVSYQLPYDSCNVDASPSFALRMGEPYGEIRLALRRGWFVSVPDYEGPKASFTAGAMAGHATIDGVRAVLQGVGPAFGLGAGQPTRVALWGYSGGALASEWAAELAVQYAPHMRWAGAALGGLTPNVSSVGALINRKDTAGLMPAGLIGMASQHPDAWAWLMRRLKTSGPHNATTFLGAARLTGVQAAALFGEQNIFDYFVGGAADLGAPVMRRMLDDDGVMGYHGTPPMRVFAYKAVGDELSAVAETDALVARYCGNGADVVYHRNGAGGHDAELFNGQARAMAFLDEVLEGQADWRGRFGGPGVKTSCEVKNVTVNVAPKWLPRLFFAWNYS